MRLAGSTIGVSISDVELHELSQLGLGEVHIRHAFVEVARQVLAGGGSLAYGGDLRAGGYSDTIVALLRTYAVAHRPPRDRVRLYLAVPAASKSTTEELAAMNALLTVVRVPSSANDLDGKAADAADYTAMRRLMTSEVSARVLVGGRVSGQAGRWPGVVEEAMIAVEQKKPLYVCGGFGGAAARVAAALQGRWSPELTTEFQTAQTPGYGEVDDAAVGPSESELRQVMVHAELNNGLSNEENKALFGTSDVDLMVALVLRGLAVKTRQQTGDRGADRPLL